MAKSPQSRTQDVRLNVAEVIPGSLARPMKMAEPSPLLLLLPASEKQLLLWSQIIAVKAPKKSAWIWSPTPETGLEKLKVRGPWPGEFVQINASPGKKFPPHPLPWSRL